MTPKKLGLSAWMILSAATVLLYLVSDLPEYPARALPLLWAFFSWNYFAYAFDKDMWPFVFVELDGGGKGKSSWRKFYFWLSVFLYAALLATIACLG